MSSNDPKDFNFPIPSREKDDEEVMPTNDQADDELKLLIENFGAEAYPPLSPNDYADQAGYLDALGDWDNKVVTVIDDITQLIARQQLQSRIDELKNNNMFPFNDMKYDRTRYLKYVEGRIKELTNSTKKENILNNYKLEDGQVQSIVKLIDDEIELNKANNDEAYNGYWYKVKAAFGMTEE